jgi:hypothetical protein
MKTFKKYLESIQNEEPKNGSSKLKIIKDSLTKEESDKIYDLMQRYEPNKKILSIEVGGNPEMIFFNYKGGNFSVLFSKWKTTWDPKNEARLFNKETGEPNLKL